MAVEESAPLNFRPFCAQPGLLPLRHFGEFLLKDHIHLRPRLRRIRIGPQSSHYPKPISEAVAQCLIASHLQWKPQVGISADFKTEELRRGDSDDHERLVIERDPLPHCRRIAAETPLPEAIADDCNRLLIAVAVVIL